MHVSPDDVQKMSPRERLALIELLWTSLVDAGETPDVSEEERAILDERLDDMKRRPDASVPWEEARARLRRSISR